MNRIVCIQKWHCDGCKLRHGTEYESHEDAAVICARIAAEHRQVSPDCNGRIWIIDREQDFAKGRNKRAA